MSEIALVDSKIPGLSIDFDEFADLYDFKPDLFIKPPSSDDDLIQNYLPSKLWRLNNLYKIVNKVGERIPFVMNVSQHKVYSASLIHARIIILKSRQQGISTFWLISFLDDCIFNYDFTIGLMAQGRAESSTLLKRVKLAWVSFPDELKRLIGVKIETDRIEEKGFSNDSTLFIRTSFRSSALTRLHVSELGKIANQNPERIEELKTGTLQTILPGNTLVIESTAEGDNEFKAMWDKAVISLAKSKRLNRRQPGKDFYPVFLGWNLDPDCNSDDEEDASKTELEYFSKLERLEGIKLTVTQKNFWIAQYRELGERIYQEYPATSLEAFTRVNDGSYYGVVFQNFVVAKNRILPKLFDINLPVHVAMDLGVNDTFVLIYFQVFREELRIIDEYTNSGEALEHYVGHMNDSGYMIDRVICPHDIEVTELSTNKTRLSVLYELGVRNITVLERSSVMDGIEQVRQRMKTLWIDPKCTYIISCASNYSKEWDEKRLTFKMKPLHDKFSHGADCLRYVVMSSASNPTTKKITHKDSYQGMAF